jgi:hypothetical protein
MTDEQRGDLMDYLAATPISNSRRLGLQVAAVGIAILAINVFMLWLEGRYYPFTVPFAFPLLLAGSSLALVGQPRSASGTPALWGRVLLVAAATIGAGVGVGVTFLLMANSHASFGAP